MKSKKILMKNKKQYSLRMKIKRMNKMKIIKMNNKYQKRKERREEN